MKVRILPGVPSSFSALVVQRKEQRPPKLWTKVRVLPGAPKIHLLLNSVTMTKNQCIGRYIELRGGVENIAEEEKEALVEVLKTTRSWEGKTKVAFKNGKVLIGSKSGEQIFGGALKLFKTQDVQTMMKRHLGREEAERVYARAMKHDK